MPKFIDLTGQKFGKLTVVERVDNIGRDTAWLCLCECGSEAVATGHKLKSGNKKTCGCSKRNVYPGETYGRLTVLKRAGERDNSGHALYLCECSCGSIVKRTAYNLSSNKEPSCGCYMRDVKIKMEGQRFGRWTVLERAHKDTRGVYWLCRCDCGVERIVNGRMLRSGKTKSCGCYYEGRQTKRGCDWGRAENPRTSMYTHGLSGTRLFRIWCGMKQRCYNPNHHKYRIYGGRGIRICDEWISDFNVFYEWAVSHGYGDDLTIDRIDVNGNYCPENCRWATSEEQSNNTRQNRFLKFNGETHTTKEWADITGINPSTLRSRLRLGWSAEEALTRPIEKRFGRDKS